MNVALVTGVGAVLPFALKEKPARWLAAAAAVGVSLGCEAGPVAAGLVIPWLGCAVVSGLFALEARDGWKAMTAGFATTASLALITSRLELTFFDIHEPIVKLTALHFTYAGAGTLSLATRLVEVRPGRLARVARWLVFVAPPIVATGFVTKWWVAQVGGALVMTAGVWLVAFQHLEDVRRGPYRPLWAMSVLSPLVAMVLGVTWAANLYWPSVPALTVVDMVPTHGVLNAFGFVLSAQVACWLSWRQR